MTAKKVAAKTSTTRTKETLSSDLAAVQAKLASADVSDPKALELARARTAEIKASVKDFSAETALQNVGKVNLEVSKLFSSVSEALIQQANHLETVSEAVLLAEKELTELHDKDVVASSLASLLAEYEAKKSEFNTKKLEVEEQWKKDADAHFKFVKEQRDEVIKQRNREQNEYEYNTEKLKKEATDKFNEQMLNLEKQNRDKQESLTKSWTLREQELAAKESVIAELKKQVDSFPTVLKSEVEKEKAIALNSMKREYEFKIQMEAKDSASAAALAKQTIAAAEARLLEQSSTIADLQKQLVAAKQQVSDIAIKALDGASGAVALERVTAFSRNNEPVSKNGKSS